MKYKNIIKGLVVALLLTTINTIPVQASELPTLYDEWGNRYEGSSAYRSNRVEGNKNYLLDWNGDIITYTKAIDFDNYGIYDEFVNNAGSDEDILGVREGLSATNFVKILTCNSPSNLTEQQYKYKVRKNSDGTMSVFTELLVRGQEASAVTQKITSIHNSIISEDMTDYDKMKAIYDWVYENVSYSKSSTANVYEVLINGKSGNSDTIAAITGRLLSRANVVHNTLAGVRGTTYHYMNLCLRGGFYYLMDVSMDLANNTKYEHFLSKAGDSYGSFSVLDYKIGAYYSGLNYSPKNYNE